MTSASSQLRYPPCCARTARIKQHLRVVPFERRTTATGLARSTVLVMAATLGSTLLGFVREVVNARYFGTSWEMDTFLAAATIPTILFGVFNGALISALVPTLSSYIVEGKSDTAWRLTSTVINALFVILLAGAALGWLLAPLYVPVIAHGFPAAQMGVAIRMTRWLMPSILAVSIGGVLTAALNAHHRFGASALQGIAINIVTIATVLVLYPHITIFALVLGTALGLVAQLAVQLPAFLRMGGYRFALDLKHPGLRTMGTMLGPIVVGSAAGQLALLFDRYFASTLSPGYIAGMNYALKLVNFPQQIFAAAIATVIFPLLSAQFAAENRSGLRASVSMGLRLVNFVTIPALCALIALGVPLVAVLFERGTFGPSATQLVAGLVPYSAVGLLALAANVVLTRACFACKQTAWPVAVSVLAVLLNILLSVTWLPTLGARGLLLANSVSQSLQAALLFVLVWRLLRGLELRAIVRSTLKIVACSAIMLATLYWISTLNVGVPATFGARAWFLCGELLIGVLAFVAAARIFGVEELMLCLRLILRKFEGNVTAPPENSEAPIA